MPPSAPEDAPPPEARGGGERVSMSGSAAGGVPRASRASASASASASAASAAGAARCRVVARFRPLTAREAESGERCVDCGNGSSGSGGAPAHQVSVVGASAEPLPFAFDAVLPERASQEEVFACVARETADRVQQGYNGASRPACACACVRLLRKALHRSCGCAACVMLAMRRALTRHARRAALFAFTGAIIAYGQSGSGKTFTMGTAGAPCSSADAKGIIPRIVAHLLADDAGGEGGTGAPACVITLTLVEVYKERIRCGGAAGRDECPIPAAGIGC
jgi:hypothetical protein